MGALNDKPDYETGTGHLLNTAYEEAAQYARYTEAVLAALIQQPTQRLSVLSERIGSYRQPSGYLEQALFYYEQSVQISQALIAAEPDNPEFKNGLAISYAQLGVFYRDQKGDAEKARGYFQQCYDLWKAVMEAHPEYAEFRKNLEWAERALE